MWFRLKRKRQSSVTAHYKEYRDTAVEQITARVHELNQLYGFEFNRVTVRNQRRCWGSCSEKRNLNFSYRLIFLPPELSDYVIVHELCHLEELNHSKRFWALVAKTVPHYKRLRSQLNRIDVRRLPRTLHVGTPEVPTFSPSIKV